MNPKKSQPNPSELAVLQLLWERGPLTVKEVHEALTADVENPIIYTTVLKTMQVMFDRGMVARKSVGRMHIYEATLSQEDTQNELLDTFLQRTFGGSAKKLAMRLLGNYSATQSDIDDLKNMIKAIENNQKAEE